MPTIVFASPKGGAGKSTSAVVLASELSRTGVDVVVIDADPNRPVSKWSKLDGKPANLAVVSDATEGTIIDEIEAWSTKVPFVVVDLEGTASMTVAYAISRADLVIIPVQGSQLDAAEAAKAIKLIRQQEKAFARRIAYAVLFTRTSAVIRPRLLGHIRQELRAADVPIFAVQMHEREAFRAIFSFGGTIETLQPSQVSNLAAASSNARAFAAEVIAMLRETAPATTGRAA
jgi:chromosome partitioning protein